MEQNEEREPEEYRGDAVTGEGGVGLDGAGAGSDAGGDPYRGDEVTGEGGVGIGDADPDPEANGAG